MATIGLDKLYYASIVEDEAGEETYDTPVQLAKAISAELSVELAETTLYSVSLPLTLILRVTALPSPLLLSKVRSLPETRQMPAASILGKQKSLRVTLAFLRIPLKTGTLPFMNLLSRLQRRANRWIWNAAQ